MGGNLFFFKKESVNFCSEFISVMELYKCIGICCIIIFCERF